MGHEKYVLALKKIALAYLLITFDINIGTLHIIPKWLGYYMFYNYLDDIAYYEKSASLLKSTALILMGYEGIVWLLALFNIQLNNYVITVIFGSIGLYFHFQLLTNLVDVAYRHGSAFTNVLKNIRTIRTIIITLLALPMETNQIIGVVIAVLGCIIEIYLCIVLNNYAKEEAKGLCLVT